MRLNPKQWSHRRRLAAATLLYATISGGFGACIGFVLDFLTAKLQIEIFEPLYTVAFFIMFTLLAVFLTLDSRRKK